MSWHNKVGDYIDHNLMDYINHFFGDRDVRKIGNGIQLNPSPCCGHNDCFRFATNMNAFNCFSCGESGNRIKALEFKLPTEEARREVSKWANITYEPDRHYDERTQAKIAKEKRMQLIYKHAVYFYRKNLVEDELAYLKQTGHLLDKGYRKHTEKGLEEFLVGLSGKYAQLKERLEKSDHNFTAEEIKEASKMIWIPEGYFVYPYYDKFGNLVRINTKLYERICNGTQDSNGNFNHDCSYRTRDLSKEAKLKHENLKRGHKMNPDGFSRGERDDVFYFQPNSLKKQKFAILVEGENDVISVAEELKEMAEKYQKDFIPIGLGGRAKEETFEGPFLRQFDAIYEAFDHDEAGDGYREMLDKKLPDMHVYSIDFDKDFDDIDNFLKSPAYEKDSFQELLDTAVYRDTKHFIIERDGKDHTWHLKNRMFKLSFTVEKFNRNHNCLEGTLFVYKNNQLVDKKTGSIDKIKLDPAMSNPKLEFSQKLDEYYNDVNWSFGKPNRDIWELVDILKFTKQRHQAIKHIAWHLHQMNSEEYEGYVRKLQQKLGTTTKDEILQEVNGFENDEVDPHATFQTITLSQFFNVPNNDAFFYYSKVVKEGDAVKIVPCLISNKKEEIRLDLLKRKDPQSLLLIKNKYLLPYEVPTAVIDHEEASLQMHWVSRWKEGKVSPEEYKPSRLIKEIEEFISKCYYLPADTLKVLSLWIYATYFYMLFRSGFPYILFTGEKGTGKSTADTLIYLLALNSKFALDMTESSLFRTISFEGGTFILDEVENLTDKRTVDANGYAKVLKGGYADLGFVYRTNMERGGMSEKFSVFGPKVISNINGLDNVIGDRCIYIKTLRATESQIRHLEDPQVYKNDRREIPHSISSRCAISALEYFQDVNKIFTQTSSRVDTGNARLTQIIKPLVTMAKFVGGDYEEALMRYYKNEITPVKNDISGSTVEGMIKNLLKRVSSEFAGIEKDKWATDSVKHIYDTPIPFDRNTGIFEINAVHIKTLCEESNDGTELSLKEITHTMKQLLGSEVDVGRKTGFAYVTINDDDYKRQFGGKRHIRVRKYILNIEDYLSDEQLKMSQVTSQKEESLF